VPALLAPTPPPRRSPRGAECVSRSLWTVSVVCCPFHPAPVFFFCPSNLPLRRFSPRRVPPILSFSLLSVFPIPYLMNSPLSNFFGKESIAKHFYPPFGSPDGPTPCTFPWTIPLLMLTTFFSLTSRCGPQLHCISHCLPLSSPTWSHLDCRCRIR